MSQTITHDTITKASEIIFANEGGYSSVNANDNGALSVGRIQWHGTRALSIIKKIVEALGAEASQYLSADFISEIKTASSWAKRTVTELEAASLSALLSSEVSRAVQDVQTEIDVSSYLEHVNKLGVTEENAMIFMADIENQGGSGASSRIIKAAEGSDIDSLYVAAINDRVFCKYVPRRKRVYLKLTGHSYGEAQYDGTTYEVVRGDTLSQIAAEYNTTIEEIAELNGITDPDRITAGQILKIPNNASTTERDIEPTPAPVVTHTHNVVRGDTLSALAKRYNTTVASILAANRTKYRAITADYIVVGWKLIIPRGETDA